MCCCSVLITSRKGGKGLVANRQQWMDDVPRAYLSTETSESIVFEAMKASSFCVYSASLHSCVRVTPGDFASTWGEV